MWGWVIGASVAIVVILLAWVLNAVRLAKQNKTWGRRSPKAFGSGGPDVNEQNRTRSNAEGDQVQRAQEAERHRTQR